jgi:hypothetical protein
MTHERISQDPFRPGFDADYRDRPKRLEEDLQNRELAEGRASSSKMWLLAICIVLVLGAVFYGLNNSSINEASTKPPPAQTAQTQPASPLPPPGVRDMTPKANTEPGQTTGAAANRPAPPAPAGQDEDRSAGQKQ